MPRTGTGVAWPPPFRRDFDAVEVLNGFTAFNAPGDRRIDDSVRDFYTLVDHGWLVSAGRQQRYPRLQLGQSMASRARFSFVLLLIRAPIRAPRAAPVPGPRIDPFDQAAFVAAVRARRTEATTGPYLEVVASPREGAAAVGPGEVVATDDGGVWLEIALAQARFVHTERIRVTIGTPRGPEVVQTIAVPPGARAFAWRGRIAIAGPDTWIGVTADGDTPMPLEQTGTYQVDKWHRAGNTPFAIASPILVDADHDGRWRRGDADLAVGP